MGQTKNSYIYPRASPFDDLGENMILFAKFGKIFSIAIFTCILFIPWVIFPLEFINTRQNLKIVLVCLSLATGMAVLILGIIVLVLLILYIIKLNDTALITRNIYLRRSFIMELVALAVFGGFNLAGNIIVPLISNRLDTFEMFNLYIEMPGLTFYLVVLIIESIVPRIFKVIAVSNLKLWADRLGEVIYDNKWSKFKKNLSQQIWKMNIGQFFALIPVLSFILPMIYYMAMEKTGMIIKQIAPHLEKKIPINPEIEKDLK